PLPRAVGLRRRHLPGDLAGELPRLFEFRGHIRRYLGGTRCQVTRRGGRADVDTLGTCLTFGDRQKDRDLLLVAGRDGPALDLALRVSGRRGGGDPDAAVVTRAL